MRRSHRRLDVCVRGERLTPAVLDRMRDVEVRAQIAAVAAEHGASDGFNQRAIRPGDQVCAEQIRTAGSMLPRSPRTVVEQGSQLRVNLVEIAGGILVDDDDVGAEALQPPVFLRLQHLMRQRHIVGAEHVYEQQGKIPGDAVRPEAGLPHRVGRNRGRRCAKRAVGAEHPRCETLEQEGVVCRHAEMMQSALRVREGERECARGRARLAVFLRQRLRGLSIGSDAGRK